LQHRALVWQEGAASRRARRALSPIGACVGERAGERANERVCVWVMGAPVCAPAAFRLARSQASALAAARQSGRDLQADTLLVVGGLYGNLTALESIEAMAQEEARNGASVKVVFNGDFNFFNAHQDDFRLLNRRILRRHQAGGNIESLGGNIEFVATAGNVELAVAGGAAGGAGCGCNYPDYVSHDIVRRSDLIVGVCMCVYVCMCVCVLSDVQTS
jgi:hypothetical protein